MSNRAPAARSQVVSPTEASATPSGTTGSPDSALLDTWKDLASSYLDLVCAGGAALVGCATKTLQDLSWSETATLSGSEGVWSRTLTLYVPAPAGGVVPRTAGFEMLTNDIRVSPDNISFSPSTIPEGESTFEIRVDTSALPANSAILRATITDGNGTDGSAICDTVRIPTPIQGSSDT